MIKEMKIPSPGESITEVEIAQWVVESGDYVDLDQVIAEIDSDKATLELTAEFAGKIELLVEDGDTVEVGSIVCKIDTSVKGESKAKKAAPKAEETKKESKVEEVKQTAVAADVKATPLAKEMMAKNDISGNVIKGTGAGGRIVKSDVENAISAGFDSSAVSGWGGSREADSKKMSSLRRKVAQRLVAVKNETAMLTTFNEVDMSPIMNIRKQHKDAFREKFGVGLGFMSFFTKAVTNALNQFPAVNAQIDGQEMITYNYADVGIAVSTPKGLMVPVVRNAEQLSLDGIESEIKRLALKARDGKLSLDDMTGGTFTITNGGVFGSMLSTPIINPPQSAILGMHNIVERPVAVNGKVEIRPIMYVALSYDHRIIDGKESVGFLYSVKEQLENPTRLMFGGQDPNKTLLGL